MHTFEILSKIKHSIIFTFFSIIVCTDLEWCNGNSMLLMLQKGCHGTVGSFLEKVTLSCYMIASVRLHIIVLFMLDDTMVCSI